MEWICKLLIPARKTTGSTGELLKFASSGRIGKPLKSEPLKVREEETFLCTKAKAKPHQMGVQGPRYLDTEISTETYFFAVTGKEIAENNANNLSHRLCRWYLTFQF